jgi:hypothetical protein
MMKGTPSLTRVPVLGSVLTWVVSGTCFTQVTMSMERPARERRSDSVGTMKAGPQKDGDRSGQAVE